MSDWRFVTGNWWEGGGRASNLGVLAKCCGRVFCRGSFYARGEDGMLPIDPVG